LVRACTLAGPALSAEKHFFARGLSPVRGPLSSFDPVRGKDENRGKKKQGNKRCGGIAAAGASKEKKGMNLFLLGPDETLVAASLLPCSSVPRTGVALRTALLTVFFCAAVGEEARAVEVVVRLLSEETRSKVEGEFFFSFSAAAMKKTKKQKSKKRPQIVVHVIISRHLVILFAHDSHRSCRGARRGM